MIKSAIIFPGQGSQYTGMGKDLYNKNPKAKKLFEEASEIVQFDIRKFCFEADPKDLYKTEKVQPSLVTINIAMFQNYMEQVGVKPLFLAGHSLGEVAALACSGAIDFAEAVKLARIRGLLMKETVSEDITMAAVIGVEDEYLREKCSKLCNKNEAVYVSLYNSPDQNVICGDKEAVSKLCREITGKTVKIMPLKINAPFHSPLMKMAADKIKMELKQFTFKPMEYTVIANSTALPYTDVNSIYQNLYTQMFMPVKWSKTIKYMKDNGIDTILEVGPNNVLTNMAEKYEKNMKFYSYEKDKEKIKSIFDKGSRPKIEVLKQCLAIIVCTPNNNWDETEYKKGVIIPYKRIEQIIETLEKRKEEPSSEQIREGMNLLRLVFQTKGTPTEEQELRFKQLADKAGFSLL
jgi:[acyl-carrier-protein] S-malonyltransferase